MTALIPRPFCPAFADVVKTESGATAQHKQDQQHRNRNANQPQENPPGFAGLPCSLPHHFHTPKARLRLRVTLRVGGTKTNAVQLRVKSFSRLTATNERDPTSFSGGNLRGDSRETIAILQKLAESGALAQCSLPLAERWLSGLRRTPGKRDYSKGNVGSNPSLSASFSKMPSTIPFKHFAASNVRWRRSEGV